MTKIKIFQSLPIVDAEKVINAWFVSHEAIIVISTQQTAVNSPFYGDCVVISILYTE